MSSHEKTPESAIPFRQCLAGADCSDFDGHTEFHKLSAEQRLLWLSEIAVFAAEARRFRETLSLESVPVAP